MTRRTSLLRRSAFWGASALLMMGTAPLAQAASVAGPEEQAPAAPVTPAAPATPPAPPAPAATPPAAKPKRVLPSAVLSSSKVVLDRKEPLDVTLFAPPPPAGFVGLSKAPTLRIWRGNNAVADFPDAVHDEARHTYTWKITHEQPWEPGYYRLSIRDEPGVLPIAWEIAATPEPRTIDPAKAWGANMEGTRPLNVDEASSRVESLLARELLKAINERRAAGVCVLVSGSDELTALHAVHDQVLARQMGQPLDLSQHAYLAFFTQDLPSGVAIRLQRAVVGQQVISAEGAPPEFAAKVDASILAKIATGVSARVVDPRVPEATPEQKPKGESPEPSAADKDKK